jgi:mono/diheme cytochrome c family protein
VLAAAVAVTGEAPQSAPSRPNIDKTLQACAQCHKDRFGSLDTAVGGGWITPGDPEASRMYMQIAKGHKKDNTRLTDADAKALFDYIKGLKAADFKTPAAVKVAGTATRATTQNANATAAARAGFARATEACGQCHKPRYESVDIAGQLTWIEPGDPEASRFYMQIARNHMKGATRLTDADAKAVFDYIVSMDPKRAAALAAAASRPVSRPSGDPTGFHLRIHCGAGKEYKGGDYKDPDGNTWLADRKYTDGGWGYVGGMAHWHPAGNPEMIENTKMETLYRSERSNMDAYKITVPADGLYTVKLHFAENFDQVVAPRQRIFSILMGGKEVIKDLDVYKEAGSYAALVKTVETQVTDGLLNVEFKTHSQWGVMINAIEVIYGKADAKSKTGAGKGAASTSAPGAKE